MSIFTHAYYRYKLLLLIVCFPLSIAFYGGWQHWRVVNVVDVEIQQLQRDSDELNDAIAKYGRKVGVRLEDGKTVSAVSVLRKTESDKNLLSTAQIWLKQFTYLPVGLGLAGALVGGIGLWFIRRAGNRALYSRDALLESFQSGLKKLPWLVGAVGLLIALGLACILAYELGNFAFFYMSNSFGGTRLFGLGIIGLGALLL